MLIEKRSLILRWGGGFSVLIQARHTCEARASKEVHFREGTQSLLRRRIREGEKVVEVGTNGWESVVVNWVRSNKGEC